MQRIPAVDTAADLIERLMIVINRMAFLEQQKRDGGLTPEQVVKIDTASRDCCEGRSAIKNRINQVFEEIAEGEYKSIREARSFRPPDTRFAEILEEHCEEIAHLFVAADLAEAIRCELLGEVDPHPALGAHDPAPVLVNRS